MNLHDELKSLGSGKPNTVTINPMQPCLSASPTLITGQKSIQTRSLANSTLPALNLPACARLRDSLISPPSSLTWNQQSGA